MCGNISGIICFKIHNRETPGPIGKLIHENYSSYAVGESVLPPLPLENPRDWIPMAHSFSYVFGRIKECTSATLTYSVVTDYHKPPRGCWSFDLEKYIVWLQKPVWHLLDLAEIFTGYEQVNLESICYFIFPSKKSRFCFLVKRKQVTKGNPLHFSYILSTKGSWKSATFLTPSTSHLNHKNANHDPRH